MVWVNSLNSFIKCSEINNNKYVCNILCNLWNKDDELNDMLNLYKTNGKKENDTQDDDQKLISMDELYEHYRSYCYAKRTMHEKSTPIISKQYFENNWACPKASFGDLCAHCLKPQNGAHTTFTLTVPQPR
jgi:hypothetical protein